MRTIYIIYILCFILGALIFNNIKETNIKETFAVDKKKLQKQTLPYIPKPINMKPIKSQSDYNPITSGIDCAKRPLHIHKGINADDILTENPPDMVWLNNERWYSKCISGQDNNKITHVRTIHYRNKYDFNPIQGLYMSSDSKRYWAPPAYSREWVEFLLKNNIKVTIGISVLKPDTELWETKWQLNQLVKDIKRWNSQPEQINKNIVCINIGNEPSHQETWTSVIKGLAYAQSLKKIEPLLKDIPISFVESVYSLYANYDNFWSGTPSTTPLIKEYKFKNEFLLAAKHIDSMSINLYPFYECMMNKLDGRYEKCTEDNIYDFVLFNNSQDMVPPPSPDNFFYTFAPQYSLTVVNYTIEQLNQNNYDINIDLSKTNITETGWSYDGPDISEPEPNKYIYKTIYNDIVSYNDEEITWVQNGETYTSATPYIIHFFTINDAYDFEPSTNTLMLQHFGADNVLLTDTERNDINKQKDMIMRMDKLSRGEDGINTEIYNNKSLQDQLRNMNKSIKCYQDNIMDLQKKGDKSGVNGKEIVDALSMCPEVNQSNSEDINKSICNLNNLESSGGRNQIANDIYNYGGDVNHPLYKRKTGQVDKEQHPNLKWIYNDPKVSYKTLDWYYGNLTKGGGVGGNLSVKNDYLCKDHLSQDQIKNLNTCEKEYNTCFTTKPDSINDLVNDGKYSKVYSGVCLRSRDTCSSIKDKGVCNNGERENENCKYNDKERVCEEKIKLCNGVLTTRAASEIKKDYDCNNSYLYDPESQKFNQYKFIGSRCTKSDDICISSKNLLDQKDTIILKVSNKYHLSEANKPQFDLLEFNINYERSYILLNDTIIIDNISNPSKFISSNGSVKDIKVYENSIDIQIDPSIIENDNAFIWQNDDKKCNNQPCNIRDITWAIRNKSEYKYIWISLRKYPSVDKLKVDLCKNISNIDKCNKSYKLNSVNSENDINEANNFKGEYLYNCVYDSSNKCVQNNYNNNMLDYDICPTNVVNTKTHDGKTYCTRSQEYDDLSGDEQLCYSSYYKNEENRQNYRCSYINDECIMNQTSTGKYSDIYKCNNLDQTSSINHNEYYCNINNLKNEQICEDSENCSDECKKLIVKCDDADINKEDCNKSYYMDNTGNSPTYNYLKCNYDDNLSKCTSSEQKCNL